MRRRLGGLRVARVSFSFASSAFSFSASLSLASLSLAALTSCEAVACLLLLGGAKIFTGFLARGALRVVVVIGAKGGRAGSERIGFMLFTFVVLVGIFGRCALNLPLRAVLCGYIPKKQAPEAKKRTQKMTKRYFRRYFHGTFRVLLVRAWRSRAARLVLLRSCSACNSAEVPLGFGEVPARLRLEDASPRLALFLAVLYCTV